MVVDTNVICYLWLSGEFTEAAEKALRKEPVWVSSFLWRSEFRNVLAGYLRKKAMTLEMALKSMDMAESLLRDHEYLVSSEKVISFVSRSTCSAYDCEFVALADELNLPLLTTDKKILREFPRIGIHLMEFVK